MKRRILLIGFIFFATGCAAKETPPPPPTPTASATPAPTPTPIPPTPTRVEIVAQVSADSANCRFGPGTVYEPRGEIRKGRLLTAVGRNVNADWWQIKDPLNPGGFCWISAQTTELRGEAESLSVVSPPSVSVLKIDLRVEPKLISVSCDQFPQAIFLEAVVTTDGPTLLNWQWESNVGVISDVGTIIFDEYGSKIINDFYRISAPGSYWIKLKIIYPNATEGKIAFSVNCS
ncbi:MAG: hypothetical protein LC099_08675 [Anaerolineales bacterium]|nr:hypothetical protein [Anaerolineales bacterium]